MRRVRLRRKSVLINLALATAMVTGVGFAYAAVDDGGGSADATRTRTGKVTKGTVQATVSASGSLTSPSDVGIGFTAAGRVTAVGVKVGDTVTAGQVLAQVDPTQAQEALDAAKAAVTVAQANLTKAQAGTPVQQNGGNGNGGGSGNQGTDAQNTVLRGSTAGSASTTGGTATTGGTGDVPAPTSTSTPAPSRTSAPPVTQPHPTVTVTVTKAPTATPTPSTTVDAAAVTQAESALIAANNKLADAQRALDGCVLKAPSAGIVASVSGKVGDTVSATTSSSGSSGSSGSGSSGGSGSTSGGGQSGSSSTGTVTGFVVIANPTGMETRVSFSEADAAKVKAGQPATVTLNVNSAIRLNAKVVSVNPLPDSGSTSGSVKYGATIALQGDVSTLRTGQTANISVVVAQADNALQVPSAAVTGTGATASVRVLVNGAEQRRTVTAGVVGDQTTQIVSGLAEGDEIVIGTVAAAGSAGSTSGRSGQSTRGGTAGGGQPAPGIGNFPGGGAVGGASAGASGGGLPRGGSR
ncbi:HlyD family efflux transporter periplasmic adaptor subunit [Embleya sp. NBC_00888]|uniref:efflux RND transporter periplasmic adaptor subunit n=1 Tax=Embleya sp. NBC_00888 TaxID=2975960 RepID=UPI0038650533|nr:HlyD family efflux transporter periplasmic adaptor subunit [Embleya sp. NBC_00888]